MPALADDVAAAAQVIALREGLTLDEVVSDLARQTLDRHKPLVIEGRNFPVLPYRFGRQPVTLEQVNRLRDEEP